MPSPRTIDAASAPWRELATSSRSRVIETAVAVRRQRLRLNSDLASPVGHVAGDQGPARLQARGDRLSISSRHLGTLRLPDNTLSEPQLARVRRARWIDVSRSDIGPLAVSRVIGQLAMAGVPMTTSVPLPVAVRTLIGTELTRLVHASRPGQLADDDAREVLSIQLRRSALQALSASAAASTRQTVGVVAVVHGTSSLERVLATVATQDVAVSEIVALTAGELSVDPRSSVARLVRVRRVADPEGALAAEIQGMQTGLVAELSPDLAYGRHHLRDLLLAQAYAHAGVVGVGVQRRYVRGLDLTVATAGTGERHGSALTAGTVMATRREWAEGRPSTGYAIHPWGAAELVETLASARAAETDHQRAGWLAAAHATDQEPPSTVPAWAGTRPANLRSYFAVTREAVNRSAASTSV